MGSVETSESFLVDLTGLSGGPEHKEAVRRLRSVGGRRFGVRYDVEVDLQLFWIYISITYIHSITRVVFWC